MPEFKITEYGLTFEVPDEPSVMDLLRFDSARVDAMGGQAYLSLWEMAKTVITKWECEIFPDHRADLNKINDPRVARMIEAAGVQVSRWRRMLDETPKN